MKDKMNEKISLVEPRIRIIAFRGKKGAGKSTAMAAIYYEIWEKTASSVKHVAFAGPLKEFCVSVLGLDSKAVYGDDKAKQTLTKYKWEETPYRAEYVKECLSIGRLPEFGLMSVRQVLQYWGTEVFRRIDRNIHLRAYLKKIKSFNCKYDPRLEIVPADIVTTDDCRFRNEALLVLGLNKKNILITVEKDDQDNTDQHPSEISLDNFVHPRHVRIKNNGTVKELHRKVMDVVLDGSLV